MSMPVSRTTSRSKSFSITDAPAWASCSAMARPIPRPAPVTNAVRPFKSRVINKVRSECDTKSLMDYFKPPRRAIALLQAILLLCGGLAAQTSPADKIRQTVRKIGLQGNVTVYMPDGHEYYGSISQIGADDF